MRQSTFNATDLQSLGALSDPTAYQEPLTITRDQLTRARQFYEQMILIRKIEFTIASLVESGEAKCPCHLAVGEEATPVGVAHSLNAKDSVYGAHRSHGHYLSLGGSPYKLLAEVLGKQDGCSHGMGGSMHLFAPEVGFQGSVPIVGATIPVATGAALAFKLAASQQIAVSYFGDGAAEEGVLHESLNLASTHELPVLFVCENNLYSSHLDIKLRQPADVVSRFATAHRVRAVVVDGNDVFAVADAASKLISDMRKDRRPAFLEAVTYRHLGHVGPDPNIDVGVRRSEADVREWKKRDPISRLKSGMLAIDASLETELTRFEKSLDSEITEWVKKSRQATYPEVSTLMSRVYPHAL